MDRSWVRPSKRAWAACAAVAVATACLGACGEKDEDAHGVETEEFTLALDFYVNPDHAGILRALERGDFSEAGLEVDTQVPADPSAPIRQVAAGQADLAISYEPEVLLALDQGLPVKAVGALVQQPLTSLIALPEAGIETPADLEGKTVATAGIPYQAAFLEAILERQRIPESSVKQVDVGLGLLPAVLSGRADAMLGGFSNIEGVDLAERGEDPRIFPITELGVPDYDELVLVANSKRLADDPEPVRLFLAALKRGTRDAAENPDAATQAVLEAGNGLDPDLTKAEVKATLPLLAQKELRFGLMREAEWEEFIRFMADKRLITSGPAPDEAFTNDLLP